MLSVEQVVIEGRMMISDSPPKLACPGLRGKRGGVRTGGASGTRPWCGFSRKTHTSACIRAVDAKAPCTVIECKTSRHGRPR